MPVRSSGISKLGSSSSNQTSASSIVDVSFEHVESCIPNDVSKRRSRQNGKKQVLPESSVKYLHMVTNTEQPQNHHTPIQSSYPEYNSNNNSNNNTLQNAGTQSLSNSSISNNNNLNNRALYRIEDTIRSTEDRSRSVYRSTNVTTQLDPVETRNQVSYVLGNQIGQVKKLSSSMSVENLHSLARNERERFHNAVKFQEQQKKEEDARVSSIVKNSNFLWYKPDRRYPWTYQSQEQDKLTAATRGMHLDTIVVNETGANSTSNNTSNNNEESKFVTPMFAQNALVQTHWALLNISAKDEAALYGDNDLMERVGRLRPAQVEIGVGTEDRLHSQGCQTVWSELQPCEEQIEIERKLTGYKQLVDIEKKQYTGGEGEEENSHFPPGISVDALNDAETASMQTLEFALAQIYYSSSGHSGGRVRSAAKIVPSLDVHIDLVAEAQCKNGAMALCADAAWVFWLDKPDSLLLRATSHRTKTDKPVRVSGTFGFEGEAVTKGLPFIVEDGENDARISPSVEKALGIQTLSGQFLPLRIEGVIVGVFSIRNRRDTVRMEKVHMYMLYGEESVERFSLRDLHAAQCLARAFETTVEKLRLENQVLQLQKLVSQVTSNK